MRCSALVIGGGAGAIEPLRSTLTSLPEDCGIPVLLDVHRHLQGNPDLPERLNRVCPLPVVEPQHKSTMKRGCVYCAPPDHHMIVKQNGTIHLVAADRAARARSSINLLFESAAHYWGNRLTGILLSGDTSDGADGMQIIRDEGGLTLVQHPPSAAYPAMPMAAIKADAVVEIVDASALARLVPSLVSRRRLVGSTRRAK